MSSLADITTIKNIANLEKLSIDNKEYALEQLIDLSMSGFIIDNYSKLTTIKNNLAFEASRLLSVCIDAILDMSNKRFCESLIECKYINKYFFNEFNTRGIQRRIKREINKSILDFNNLNDWLQNTYITIESNKSLEGRIYITDKDSLTVIKTINLNPLRIKILEKSEKLTREYLEELYILNTIN